MGLLLLSIAKVVEERHAIGFRPDANFPWAREAIIVRLDDFVAVESDGELIAFEIDPKRMPHPGGNFRSDAFERDAPSTDSVVDSDVVLQRVGPRDVVVVCILSAPDHAS